MKFGQIVYHVAFPDVKAVVVGPFAQNHYGLVTFSKPVTFPGHTQASTSWMCNENLLFETSAEAIEAHDPDWETKGSPTEPRKGPPLKTLYDHLREDSA